MHATARPWHDTRREQRHSRAAAPSGHQAPPLQAAAEGVVAAGSPPAAPLLQKGPKRSWAPAAPLLQKGTKRSSCCPLLQEPPAAASEPQHLEEETPPLPLRALPWWAWCCYPHLRPLDFSLQLRRAVPQWRPLPQQWLGGRWSLQAAGGSHQLNHLPCHQLTQLSWLHSWWRPRPCPGQARAWLWVAVWRVRARKHQL